jgi:uncharacterized membrane protein YjjP (DUF1212 family)
MHQTIMSAPGTAHGTDPALDHSELEHIAMAALEVGRLLIETGARAEIVHEDSSLVAHGLGADHVDVRSGYASLDITVARGASTVTRMTEVGAHGVNYLLGHAIRNFAQQISRGGLTASKGLEELTRLKRDTPHRAPWLVAFAVGIACASFGRLLGIDWPAFMPVAVAGAIGQTVRQQMLHRGANVFVLAGAVAFVSSSLGELGAKWAGSTSVSLAMIASVLLLVPGVPALNAQSDIMEGYPTLGTARAVCVIVLLTFIAVGILLARAVLGVQP